MLAEVFLGAIGVANSKYITRWNGANWEALSSRKGA